MIVFILQKKVLKLFSFNFLGFTLYDKNDDILSLMMNNNSNFFRLAANKSKDKRDHYFFFKVNTPQENNTVRIFKYIGHKYQLQK